MPFTPIHMGPGILIKSLLQGSFSLMVFGWTQIVMDIQPLIVLISGEGHLHGFTHTYIGAILIAIFADHKTSVGFKQEVLDLEKYQLDRMRSRYDVLRKLRELSKVVYEHQQEFGNDVVVEQKDNINC